MSSPILTVLPPLGPGALRPSPATQLPYPLGEGEAALSAWGRNSLHTGLRALGIGAGDRVLAPAYHHGSEIEAILATGAECSFYGAGPSLAPDEDELEELLDPRVRALHITHYLGFPQDSRCWRAWADERGLLLIEDAAQAWLAGDGDRPVGSFGDLSIFCLYKMAPLPDGAALVTRGGDEVPIHQGQPLGVGRAAKRAAGWLAQRSGRLGTLAQRRLDPGEFEPRVEMALGELTAASRATTVLLPRLRYARIRERRRANYARLLEALGEHAPAPFDRLPDGATPWLFPVEAPGKAGMLALLAGQGILAFDFWSVPHRELGGEHARALRGRRSTVGLPVHQELRESDLDRIATVAASWLA